MQHSPNKNATQNPPGRLIGYDNGVKSPPLVCLHGFGGSGPDFEQLGQVFTSKRVIAPNLPGHGGLRFDEWSTMRHLTALRERIEFPVDVLGYSMGARVALHWLIERKLPVRSLTLIGATPGLRTKAERIARLEFESTVSHRLQTNTPIEFQNWWASLPIIRSQSRMPKKAREAMTLRRQKNSLPCLNQALSEWSTARRPNLWKRLVEIKVPVILIVGKQDLKYSALAREMVEMCPNARLELIDGCGHAPHLEKAQIVAQRLDTIL